ncbi:MAG: D-Ala-D-Ala carboxypeptidase family metallohydrolase [Candidatus Cloacimonetes bacterium]|jgi:uncharacterized protein YcbK (DUF882 family)
MKLSKNLDDSEIRCKCGCGLNKISDLTVQKFQNARDFAGFPFIVTSGCRCPKYNKKIGGVANSAHTPNAKGICQAIDIAFKDSNQCFFIVKGLILAGVKRIGINFDKHFIHFDTDSTKPQNVLFKY